MVNFSVLELALSPELIAGAAITHHLLFHFLAVLDIFLLDVGEGVHVVLLFPLAHFNMLVAVHLQQEHIVFELGNDARLGSHLLFISHHFLKQLAYPPNFELFKAGVISHTLQHVVRLQLQYGLSKLGLQPPQCLVLSLLKLLRQVAHDHLFGFAHGIQTHNKLGLNNHHQDSLVRLLGQSSVSGGSSITRFIGFPFGPMCFVSCGKNCGTCWCFYFNS